VSKLDPLAIHYPGPHRHPRSVYHHVLENDHLIEFDLRLWDDVQSRSAALDWSPGVIGAS
jgi:hypothetical protein